MTRAQRVFLFIMWNASFLFLYFVWPPGLRLAVIVASFVAMWSLWVARRERSHLWTPKLHDIWLIQFLWCVAAAEGNSELFYRHARPSLAVLLVAAILGLTIKGVFNGEKYTVDQP